MGGTEVWKRDTAPGRASLERNECAAPSGTATLRRAMGLKCLYIYLYLKKKKNIYIHAHIYVSWRRIETVLVFI